MSIEHATIEPLTYDEVTSVLRAHSLMPRFEDRYRHLQIARNAGLVDVVPISEHHTGTFTIGDELMANAKGQLILPIAYGQEVLQVVKNFKT